jgi:homoserine kinase type II
MPNVLVDAEFLVGLAPVWGFSADVDFVRADRGTNNQTFVLSQGGRRFALRISQNLSVAQIRAEHRLLGRLRQAGLPFAVPEPVTAPDGRTVIETPAGAATLCRWLPGVRPDLDDDLALERFGRAVGLLGDAMRTVPLEDAPQDWRDDPLRAGLDGVPGEDLYRELGAAGVSGEQAALLAAAAGRVARWWSGAGGELPVQVVHGDPAASNALVDLDTGQVSALLDFEFAGVGFGVQDFVAALFNSGLLREQAWRRRTRAFLRGHASVRRLSTVEIQALPDLLISRSLDSAMWRAARWRRGQTPIGEVIDRLQRLETTTRWLAASGQEFCSLVAASGTR